MFSEAPPRSYLEPDCRNKRCNWSKKTGQTLRRMTKVSMQLSKREKNNTLVTFFNTSTTHTTKETSPVSYRLIESVIRKYSRQLCRSIARIEYKFTTVSCNERLQITVGIRNCWVIVNALVATIATIEIQLI